MIHNTNKRKLEQVLRDGPKMTSTTRPFQYIASLITPSQWIRQEVEDITIDMGEMDVFI